VIAGSARDRASHAPEEAWRARRASAAHEQQQALAGHALPSDLHRRRPELEGHPGLSGRFLERRGARWRRVALLSHSRAIGDFRCRPGRLPEPGACLWHQIHWKAARDTTRGPVHQAVESFGCRVRILGEMYRRGGVSAGVSPVTRTRASAASLAGATASDPLAPVPGAALGAPLSRPAPSIRFSASATSRATTAASWSSAPSSRSCRERFRRHLPSAEFADGPALPEAVGGPSPPPCLGGDGR
jgi:hypothetical protein